MRTCRRGHEYEPGNGCPFCSAIASRKWEKRNRQRCIDSDRAWVHKNPEKFAARMIRYRDRHRRECSLRSARWAKSNPEKRCLYENCRRARKRGLTTIKDPRIIAVYFIARWLRQQGDDMHVDHVIPLARGGPHTYENLQILPAVENRRKWAHFPRADLTPARTRGILTKNK